MVNTSADEYGARETPDGLTVYFSRSETISGSLDIRLFSITRPSISGAFGPTAFFEGGAFNRASTQDSNAHLAPNLLSVVFQRGMNSAYDIYYSSRSALGSAWATPSLIEDVSTNAQDVTPFFHAKTGKLYFTRGTTEPTFDLYRADLTSGVASAIEKVPLSMDGEMDSHPVLSADGLTLWFSSTRPNGLGKLDVWTATRTTTTAEFGSPSAVSPFNSAEDDFPSAVSDDGCRFYMSSTRAGNYEIYVATRPANGTRCGNSSAAIRAAVRDKSGTSRHP